MKNIYIIKKDYQLVIMNNQNSVTPAKNAGGFNRARHKFRKLVESRLSSALVMIFWLFTLSS